MRPLVVGAMVIAAIATLSLTTLRGQAPAQPRPSARVVAVAGSSASDVDRQIVALQRSGALRLSASVEDRLVEGRVHDRFQQYVGEARIWGGEVVRQRSSRGVETVFGNLYDDLRIDATPRIAAETAVARATAIAGRAPLAGRAPELVVLPMDDGSFRLTWYVRVLTGSDLIALFIDARTGEEAHRYSDLRTQSAVGTGTGVLNDRKKISARQSGSVFLADDALRPPSLVTYDLRGNPARTDAILEGVIAASQSDIASDTDNTWSDGPIVDAHVYLGFTYDYFFKRFQRRGFDGNDRRIERIVHPANRNELFTYPHRGRGDLPGECVLVRRLRLGRQRVHVVRRRRASQRLRRHDRPGPQLFLGELRDRGARGTRTA